MAVIDQQGGDFELWERLREVAGAGEILVLEILDQMSQALRNIEASNYRIGCCPFVRSACTIIFNCTVFTAPE